MAVNSALQGKNAPTSGDATARPEPRVASATAGGAAAGGLHEALRDIDWQPVCDEAVEVLRALIRFDTTNPPGNELLAARCVADKLAAAGIEPTVLESAPGRGNVVARIKATRPPDGTDRPLLLSSHLDVVPAEPAKWDRPPFAAELVGGVIYGRGAVDMKNMTAMSLATLLLVKRQRIPLARDLIMVACADEETGSELGSRWLVAHHPELVRAEYVLNELGGFTQHFAGKRIYPIQVAEKGTCWCTITCEGEPGHGSIPAPDAALPRLCTAAAKLAKTRLPQHRVPVVDRFLAETAAATQSMPIALVLRLLRVPALAPWVLKRLPDAELACTLDACLRNTANPTVIRSGRQVNVVPSVAEMKVDGRVLPGQTMESFVAELQAVIGPGFSIRVDRGHPGVVSDPDDPVMQVLSAVIKDHDPDAHVVPAIIPGFTDNAAYAALGARCYGFVPLQVDPAVRFASLFHGHNERISVDGFRWGLRALIDAVLRIAA